MNKYCPRCSQRYDDGQQRFCLRDGALLSLPDSYRLVGATLDGKYRIDALVGLGGFGAVYSAWHLGLDRQVAFKILQPNVALQAPEAVALFEGEAKTAARLHHEHIVAIHDAGRTADGLSYIAMEWLEGRPLDEDLKAEGRLSFERTAAILRQVALALAHAHAHRTVHRDLKPSNVMLIQRAGVGERVKVVDFGIAKVLSSSAGSMVSRSIGTPAYASPEQWKHGAQIDGRADIYSLGVMLYEMLSGSLPFRARSVEELIQVKLSAAPLPGAPAALDDLLRRMMSVDPALRPPTVAEVPGLFDAARQTHSHLLRAPTVAEPTEQMRQSEIERIAAPPPIVPARKQPPAPEPPQEQKPVERVTPQPEVVRLPAATPPEVVPSRSSKKRIGVAASILAVTAMLGYVSWSQFSSKPSSDPPPVGNASNLLSEDLGNGVKIEMVKLPGGEFTMGSNDGENDEKPQHQVKVSPFAIGKYEVTQRQWKAVMGDNPSNFKGDDLPVENVSWDMVQTFLQRLNGRYRLPTEAEWEYAARAGSHGRYSFGDDENELRNYAWFLGNSNSQTHPVGQLKPNRFGLYDTHGNVWEWCSDWYGESYYKQSAATDPQGPSAGSGRVIRGGGWYYGAVRCRSAFRSGLAPGYHGDDVGFRLVRDGP